MPTSSGWGHLDWYHIADFEMQKQRKIIQSKVWAVRGWGNLSLQRRSMVTEVSMAVCGVTLSWFTQKTKVQSTLIGWIEMTHICINIFFFRWNLLWQPHGRVFSVRFQYRFNKWCSSLFSPRPQYIGETNDKPNNQLSSTRTLRHLLQWTWTGCSLSLLLLKVRV